MPVDFGTGSAALVEFGDGTANDPQIRFTADDESCMWNEFPIAIVACPREDITVNQPTESRELTAEFITTPGGGGSVPTPAEWPPIYIYDVWELVAQNTDCLTFRMRFTTVNHGTSVGSIGFQIQTGGFCGSQPGPIVGDYDSGVITVGATCLSCSTMPDVIAISPLFTNFSPIAGSVGITKGIMNWTLGAGTFTPATYAPGQVFGIVWNPPCTTDAGLFIYLETDNCGVLQKTYTQVANEVNALSLGITATILGGHGGDTAKPDPASTIHQEPCSDILFFGKPMAGATCTGALDT